ncbi:hypothetical protein D9615_001834 [Tricholomella constricta]|uniref:Uncharacterized protein n=1 Tax=Tricholomella constricta TaxID=117010 RepID=A0A8H5MAQ0_9AGAR|nr:hypothetical protein D9615_001834 [Tricholomella constricta]
MPRGRSRLIQGFISKKTGTNLNRYVGSYVHAVKKYFRSRARTAPSSANVLSIQPPSGRDSPNLVCIPQPVPPRSAVSSDLIPQAEPEKSMSRRRPVLNIPALQPNLSLTSSCGTKSIFPSEGSIFELLSLAECLTPITPVEKMLHTPSCPPSLVRHATNVSWPRREPRRSGKSNLSPYSPLLPDFAQPSPQFLATPQTSSPSVQVLHRRLSLVVPPDASPVYAPRRLSYSRSFLRTNLIMTPVNPPSDKKLASPLSIRSQRPIRSPSIDEYRDDMCFAPSDPY